MRLVCTSIAFTVIVMCAIACSAKNESNRVRPDGWITMDAQGLFSFDAPANTKGGAIQGIDSAVGEYQVGDIKLLYDHGWYSSDLKEPGGAKAYTHEKVKVDGWWAELVTLDEGNMGIFFPKTPSGKKMKLTLHARFTEPESSDLVRKIFLSIRFAR